MTAASEPENGRPEGTESDSRRFIESGLAMLGLQAAEDEIAVIQAVDAIYNPSLEALTAEGFDGIPHEPGADMSKPPRTDSER